MSTTKALVIGLGVSGQAASHFLLKKGYTVYGTDKNALLLQNHPAIESLLAAGAQVYLEEAIQEISDFDLIIASPGIPPSHALYKAARQAGKEVIGEIALGCRFLEKHPVVGITGTNGKTTATLLLTHILNQSGQQARALGNVGKPLTEDLLLLKPQEQVILELSSYQLETLCQPILDVGVILNITPDHLDRYPSMEAYASAKCALESCLKPNGWLYIEEETYQRYHHLLKNERCRKYGYHPHCFIWTDLFEIFVENQPLFKLPEWLQGKRSHDLENILATYAVCHTQGLDPDDFVKGLHTFKKPPHRLEFIVEREGIRFYDDSKGTNIDAVIRAVESLTGPMILIAGGVDKGAAYTPWLAAFEKKVKCICAIGQAATKMQVQLAAEIPVYIFENLEEAVKGALQQAEVGSCILLSPGCSSYDMFRDYVHRGQEFQRLVHQYSPLLNPLFK